jgi:hypothetical protein
VLGHILNITNGFIDGIILMVTLLAILSRHYIVCLFESHCNSVSNGVCKNLHVIVLFGFFILSIMTGISSVYTDDIFLSVFTDGVSNGKNSVDKDHRKISMENIYRYFCLYSSIL